VGATLWYAESDDKDFRNKLWQSENLHIGNKAGCLQCLTTHLSKMRRIAIAIIFNLLLTKSFVFGQSAKEQLSIASVMTN
jgi:hypothetical protein